MSGRRRDRARLALRLAETWWRRPKGPNRIVLSVTRRCNLRCRSCQTWAHRAPRPELSPAQLGAALRPLPALSWLDVTGGEILLRDDIEELFAELLAASPKLRVLHFPTNGWFPERALSLTRRVRALRPEVELLITVSLDGPPAVHDALRGRGGSFDRALETLLALRAVPGAAVYVGTTVSVDNAPHLPALEQILAAQVPGFHLRDWHWNWVQRSAHFFRNEAVSATPAPDPALLDAHIRRRGLPRDMVGLAELGFLANLSARLHGDKVTIPCQALRSTCFLSPEGDLYPCHVWDRPLGNVLDRDLLTLWRDPALARARRDIERGGCPDCFTACEAYPALAGAPLAAAVNTTRALFGLLRRWRSRVAGPQDARK